MEMILDNKILWSFLMAFIKVNTNYYYHLDNKATVLHVYRDYLFLFNGKFDNT